MGLGENIQHLTSNIQCRASSCAQYHWVLVVGCWAFDVPVSQSGDLPLASSPACAGHADRPHAKTSRQFEACRSNAPASWSAVGLPVLRSSTAEGGARNGTDTALDQRSTMRTMI